LPQVLNAIAFFPKTEQPSHLLVYLYYCNICLKYNELISAEKKLVQFTQSLVESPLRKLPALVEITNNFLHSHHEPLSLSSACGLDGIGVSTYCL
jgi:hypothetical protein